MAFAQSGFAQFITSDARRAVRVAAGLALIGAGVARRDSAAGAGLMIAGVVPLAAGAFDLCLLSPLFGGPLDGAKVRAAGPGQSTA